MPPDTPFCAKAHPFTSITSLLEVRWLPPSSNLLFVIAGLCLIHGLCGATVFLKWILAYGYDFRTSSWIWVFKAYALLWAIRVSFRHIKGLVHWIKVISPTRSPLQPPPKAAPAHTNIWPAGEELTHQLSQSPFLLSYHTFTNTNALLCFLLLFFPFSTIQCSM